jgi:hypothetical protein
MWRRKNAGLGREDCMQGLPGTAGGSVTRLSLFSRRSIACSVARDICDGILPADFVKKFSKKSIDSFGDESYNKRNHSKPSKLLGIEAEGKRGGREMSVVREREGDMSIQLSQLPWLKSLLLLLKDLRYGSITLVVQDGKIVQMERLEKNRLC